MQPKQIIEKNTLQRTLGPLMLWGLGVGYVISGMYFGWNLGLPVGGTLGLAIATFFIIILYITFTFSYTELACAIPKAGGVFDYAGRAMGIDIGFIAGMAQIIEFVFAPPAIAAAIGAYFHIFFPQFSVTGIAIVAYILFTALNIYGVRAAAMFELLITAFAVLHHIPSREMRLNILRVVRELLSDDGLFIHSNWQFLNSEKLKARIQPWDAAAISPSDVDAGDYLLDWRSGGEGLRYVHHFNELELNDLAGTTGFQAVETFSSDGETGNLGLYQVWKPSS